MLKPFAPDLWLAEGPTVSFLGLPYPTRMAVVRLAGGRLWLWSPVAWSEALDRELAALGPVAHLVSPNRLHHLFLGEWKTRHPQARLWASPGLPARRQDLAFDGELGDEPPGDWAGEIDQVAFRGSAFLDEIVFHHRASRTALVCDLVQRFDPDDFSGWRRALMRAWGLVGERGSTPLEWRALWWRRAPARAALARALAWKFERLVIAHGRCAPAQGAEVLATGLRWLGPPRDS